MKPVAEGVGKGIYINVYGRNGTGKTTFGCTFPKPLLLLGIEDGRKSVKNVDGVMFIQIESTLEIAEIAKGLATNHKGDFASVVIDTATSLQDLCLKEIMGLSELPVQMGWGFARREHYQGRAEKTKELLRLFFNIKSVDPDLNMVILAQEKDHTERGGSEEGGPASPGYETDVLMPFIASSLGKSTCSWLQDNVDHICQTFVRDEMREKELTAGNMTVKKLVRTGKREFCLRTERAHPIFAAKIRADRGSEIPEVISYPTYDKLIKYL